MKDNKTSIKVPETPQLVDVDKKPKERVIDHAMDSKKWSSRYDVAKTHQLPMFKRWAKWYDDMYAHVHNQQMAPWRSKVYMPIIASKVWDLISRFIQYRPGWDVKVRTLPVNTLSNEEFDAYMTEMSKRVEKVKMKLDYDYDNPLREESIPDELLGTMLDAAVTGQGVGRSYYCKKSTEYRNYVADGDSVDFSKVSNKKAKEGYNDFQAINIFNFFISPNAKGLQKAPWVIVHDYIPVYELEKDPKYDQEKVKMLKTTGVTNEFAQYEAARNRLVTSQDTSSLDSTTKIAETFECWDKETNECVFYGLGQADKGSTWVELYREANVYWHKKYPFVPFYIRRKPYQFWGESLFENSETLQSAVNDIFNHFMDGHNMADGMLAIEEGSIVSPYVVEPGGEFHYRGEMPKQLRFPPPDAANMQTAMNLINGSIENATISQYASGIPNSSTDSTQGTATGVTRMMEAAAEKVGFMRSNFRRSWREVGQMWHSNTQQFMQTDVTFEKKKNGEATYELLRPVDMIGIFGISIDDGSFEPVSKDEKRKNYLEFIQNLIAWQSTSVDQAERTGDPTDALRMNWNDIATRGAEHYGESLSKFTLPTKVAETPKEEPSETGLPALPPQAPEFLPPPEEGTPLSADDVLGLETSLSEQPDGKSMPDTFPMRSIKNPTL